MIYAVFTKPDAGHDYDMQKVRNAGLALGEKYELEDADIDRWCSTVKLKGFPEWFNSVHFDFVNDENQNYDFYKDKRFYSVWGY